MTDRTAALLIPNPNAIVPTSTRISSDIQRSWLRRRASLSILPAYAIAGIEGEPRGPTGKYNAQGQWRGVKLEHAAASPQYRRGPAAREKDRAAGIVPPPPAASRQPARSRATSCSARPPESPSVSVV